MLTLSRLFQLLRRKQPRSLSLLEPVALSSDVNGRGVMQQPVENGGGDRGLSEDLSPIGIALVGGQEDAAAFVAGADQLKEDRCSYRVQRQIADFIYDQDL